MTFQLRVERALTKSPICIGLDPDLNKLPSAFKKEPASILEFNKKIIETTCDLAGAYKPNFAFYEAFGAQGWEILEGTIRLIRSATPETIIIADAKRGDIGNTAALYAQSVFYHLGCDAITVSPYMGLDSVQPFIADKNYGAFVLCLTSNEGSKDFQYRTTEDKKMYEFVAEKVSGWDNHRNCGLVVGATHSDEMAAVRKISGAMPFLIPGIGAQGGDLESAVKINFDGQKVNAFINSSRAILYASGGNDFAEAARKAAIAMKNQIEAVI